MVHDFISNLAEPVERWSLFRIMEWLRSIELAEFATNLRGTGVHGGLIALEPGFGGEHFATLLQMSQKKTLLRKHLHNNFEMLLDDEQQQVPWSSEFSGKYLWFLV